MTKPIKPVEVKKEIPDEIIQAFNDLITESYDGEEAYVKQDDAMERAMMNFKKAGKRIKRDDIFKKGWMDVEAHYRKAGWQVKYDKPAYCEDYDASFIFKKKESR